MLSAKIQHLFASFPKQPIVFTSDILFTLAAMLCTYLIKPFMLFNPKNSPEDTIILIIAIVAIQAASYWVFGLYRGVWRFASIPDLIRIIKACVIGTLLLFFINTNLSLPLFCLLTITMLSSTRLAYRCYKDNALASQHTDNVLIIGAGTGGESIIREIKRDSKQKLRPVALIDDNPAKLGLEIHGVRVLGTSDDLPALVKRLAIQLILIAIPTANTVQMRRVVSLCEKANIPYRTLPNLNDIVSGKAQITSIRPVSVEDLLSRDPITFNREQLNECIAGKKILVTGAGGSIGSALCQKIAEYHPCAIIMLEHSEYNLFQIQQSMQKKFASLAIHSHLLSITDQEMVIKIMQQHMPDYVFHAAAYKHVPLLEPQERIAIFNNVFGTEIVARAAALCRVKKFIMVSTDKAVNPSNIMGATKRCAEKICHYLNYQMPTQYITVRFGNVLGSTGSVVPLFKQQIAQGGPITVTHPDVERYFMTIAEAVQLVIQTITIKNPSDLYVLDMGEPVKIKHLAEQMIKLSGQQPHEDIKIIYSGLRPGEKINEELFYANEDYSFTDHEKIIRVNSPTLNHHQFENDYEQLKKAYFAHDENLKSYLYRLSST